MARVNVYLPDRIYRSAKRARLNVSEVCQLAIESELQRRARMRALAGFAEELEARFGPASTREVAEAEAWANGVIEAASRARGTGRARPNRARRAG